MRARWLLAIALLLLFAAPSSARTGFSFTLSGGSEIPPLETTGAGSGVCLLSDAGDTLVISLSFTGLQGDFAAAHIHGPGSPTQFSGLRFTLEVVPSPDLRSGTCLSVWAIPEVERGWLTSGLFYVNVHSLFSPNGELRGQILADPTPTRRTTFARLKALYR